MLPCTVCGEEVGTGSWCAGLWGLIEAMVLVLLLLVRAMSHVVSASSWHGSLTLRIWVIFLPRVSWVSLGSSGGGLTVLLWGGGMVGGGDWIFDMFLGRFGWITSGVFFEYAIRVAFMLIIQS